MMDLDFDPYADTEDFVRDWGATFVWASVLLGCLVLEGVGFRLLCTCW